MVDKKFNDYFTTTYKWQEVPFKCMLTQKSVGSYYHDCLSTLASLVSLSLLLNINVQSLTALNAYVRCCDKCHSTMYHH